MTRLALVEPKTLLGEAVRDSIGGETSPWDQIELFALDAEEVGAVTEVGGRAAIVQALEEDTFDSFDTVVFCDPETAPATVRSVPDRCTAIVIDPSEPLANAVAVVAGVNDDDASGSGVLVSPSPVVIMLAHLLSPLRGVATVQVTAHGLQPASARGKGGLDELFDQTRAILSMSDERPDSEFGTQLAFNLLPWRGTSAQLGQQLDTILGNDFESHIQLSQAGVFHGCCASIFLDTADSLSPDRLRDRLQDHPLVELSEVPELLGPVAASTTDRILVGEIVEPPGRGLWLWCCADNLTLSAVNAMALARP